MTASDSTPAAPWDDAWLRQVLGYVGQVRDALGMQQWEIIVHREPDEEDDVWARCWTSQNHYCLNIKFGALLPGVSEEVMRSTITHELVHAMHRNVSAVWEQAVAHGDHHPGPLRREYDRQFHVEIERFVDWVTRAMIANVPQYSARKTYPLGPLLFLWDSAREIPEIPET